MFIPDPDADFLPIPDPGSRGSKRHRIPDPGSGSATLTVSKNKRPGLKFLSSEHFKKKVPNLPLSSLSLFLKPEEVPYSKTVIVKIEVLMKIFQPYSICLCRWDPEKAGDKPKMVEYKVGKISFTEQNSWVPVPYRTRVVILD